VHNIPFNKLCFEGKELVYIADAINQGHLSGNDFFSRKCSEYMETALGCKKVLLTTSCTPAMDSKWQGKKLGQEMIIQSLRYLYNQGARPVETNISASKSWYSKYALQFAWTIHHGRTMTARVSTG
jgi:dTDP-4-amino-4,6-dideoxygalactose transaminase